MLRAEGTRKRHRRFHVEPLERRHLLTGGVVISEFVASNDSTLNDRDGDSSDWIELFNTSEKSINLDGWYLTDDLDELDKWQLPSVAIDPGEFEIIFASDKDRINPAAQLHTNFRLSARGESLALIEPDGETIAHGYDRFPQQFTDIAFGLSTEVDPLDISVPGYLLEPTPGKPNGITSEQPPSGNVSYSISGRTFAESFDLVLSSPARDAVIRYTTDGSIPDEDADQYVEPIRVATSMRIRARAFQPGRSAGPVNSQAYIALADDLLTFEGDVFDSNLPLMVFHSFGGNVHSNASNLVPVASVFINNDDGRASLLDEPEFAGRAGLRIRGQSSQGWPKKQYALEIWEEGNSDTRPINASRADDRSIPIFGLPSESDWVLNGPYSDKTQLNNYLTFSWSRAMGQYAPRARLVEVFVKTGNGELSYRRDYRGTYVLLEKIKIDDARVDISELSPGVTDEPDISGGYIWKYDKDGAGDVNFRTTFQSRTGSSRPWKFVEPERPPRAQRDWLTDHLRDFERVLYGSGFDDPVRGYARYIDVDSWIDTWLMVELTKNIDGFRLSTYYHKDRGGKIKQGPAWDYNLSLANANYLQGAYPTGWYHDSLSSRDYPYWDRLFDDPNFEIRVRDRWFELRSTIFSTENLLGDVDQAVALLTDGNPNLGDVADGQPSNPISRNFDRWGTLGTYLWPNCFFSSGACPPSPLPGRARPDSYGDYVFILKDFVERRAAWIDRQFRAPPAIQPEGGFIGETNEVRLRAVSRGTVYYTLDGSDPRDPETGEPSASALEYTSPIQLKTNAVVQTRSLAGSRWSAKSSQTFFVSIPTIEISEINFNPAQPSNGERAAGYFDNDAFEFVELHNFGDAPVSVGKMSFVDGINVVLDDMTVPADARVVVVRNEAAFRFRYGDSAKIAGLFGNPNEEDLDFKLSNSGERLVLIGALGEPILDVTYDDEWFPLTDGEGFSLVRRSVGVSEANQQNAWRPSEFLHGSPGMVASGAVPGPDDLVINEVTGTTGEPHRVELWNRTNRPFSIGGFYVTDERDSPRKFRIPLETRIPANDFIVLDKEIMGETFQIDETGEFSIRGALPDGTLTGYSQTVQFGSLDARLSWGRVETSVGSDFAPLSSVTMGEPNSDPQFGPIVINEIHYHPFEDEHEFIELKNTSNQSVDISGWEFSEGIRYEFPDGTQVAAGAYVVLIQIGDDAQANRELVSFRSENDVPDAAEVLAFRQAQGSLSNAGESLVLERPASGSIQPAVVDRVFYSDEPPWNSRADGEGPSLSKTQPKQFGNDPASWRSSPKGGTPGRDNRFEDSTPPSAPENLFAKYLGDEGAALAWSPAVDPDSSVHYVVYRDGSQIATSSIPFFRDENLVWNKEVTYGWRVVAVNADGFESEMSNRAQLQVASTSFQQDIAGYSGVSDAYISETNPDENRGDDRRIIIDGNAAEESGSADFALVRWADLDIPDDVLIVGASVGLNVVNSGDEFEIKPILQAWEEDEVTWNHAVSGQPWQTPGAKGIGDVGAQVSTLRASAREYLTTHLGGAGIRVVTNWLANPAENHGFIIVDPGGSTNSVIFSSAQSSVPDLGPKLTILHVPTTAHVEGDLNLDGAPDAADIDLLHAAIRNGMGDPLFDLNHDGHVNSDDVDFMLIEVLHTNRGDADLDGSVSFVDFLALSLAFQNQGERHWKEGDFDGDGNVTFADFLLLSANFGQS